MDKLETLKRITTVLIYKKFDSLIKKCNQKISAKAIKWLFIREFWDDSDEQYALFIEYLIIKNIWSWE